MFEFFRGKLIASSPTKAVVDVGGVGYAIQISLKTYQALPQTNTDILIHVAPIIREDEHTLYGFLNIEEKNLFSHLISISGIGPKTAVAILGHVDISDFQLAILQSNTALLSKIPGIGKKTAERLVIELRDKFHRAPPQNSSFSSPQSSTTADAISALINLGYHPLEAQKRVKQALSVEKGESSLPTLISAALKI